LTARTRIRAGLPFARGPANADRVDALTPMVCVPKLNV